MCFRCGGIHARIRPPSPNGLENNNINIIMIDLDVSLVEYFSDFTAVIDNVVCSSTCGST